MRAGKLDRVISLERLTETVAASGAVTSNWTPFATLRAELVQLDTTEALAGFGESVNTAVSFRIRWGVTVTPADRVVLDGVSFNIKAVSEIGRRRGLELRAVAA